MANCKVCNAPIPEGTELCDDCRIKLAERDEQYLDQLLASVTGEPVKPKVEPYQATNDQSQPLPQENEVAYTKEELASKNSKDDDWNLLNESITNQPDSSTGYVEYDKGIPAEGALDEVDSILMDDYDAVLQDIANGQNSNKEEDIAAVTESDQKVIRDDLVDENLIDDKEDMLNIPDAIVTEDMQNPLVDQEIISSLDEDMPKLYDTVADPNALTDHPFDEIEKEAEIPSEYEMPKDDDFLASLLADEAANVPMDEDGEEKEDVIEPEVEDAGYTVLEPENIEPESIEAESIEPESTEPAIEAMPEYSTESAIEAEPENTEPISDVQLDMIEDLEPAIEASPPQMDEDSESNEATDSQDILEPLQEEELAPIVPGSEDELTELDKLLGEVTQNVDDFNIDNIMSTDAMNTEESNGKKVNPGDVLSQSLSAVSDMDDPALEEQFNSILPNTAPEEEKKKVGLFKKLFDNIPPEDPEAEMEQMAKEEELQKEKKQKKEEDKQKKAAQKEEQKAKKAAAKEDKKKSQEAEKERQKKARDAIAAAYVPEGKINKAGAFVVFSLAACVAFLIIQGTDYATYHLSIQSAEKDYKNSRYDEAYETLSGETIKEKDALIYDKLQTIMIVKKELNSYYNFIKMNKELEALDSVIKGIDKYERYIANAKELKIEGELNSLKKEMLTILITKYNLSENETIALIDIKDANEYTNQLNSIVSTIPKDEDSNQLAKKN